MPINEPITYAYEPPYPTGSSPKIHSYQSYRARSDIGGTFFRSIDTGDIGNRVSVEFVTSGLNVTMTVRGPVTLGPIEYTGTGSGSLGNVNFSEAPIFQEFTVSCVSEGVFSVLGSVSGSLGVANIDTLFLHEEIVFTLKSGDQPFIVGDEFTFELVDPTEIYTADNNEDLNLYEPVPEGEEPPPLLPSPAYATLRLLVNADSKFLEMSTRGYDYVDLYGTDDITGRTVRPAVEVLDEGGVPLDPQPPPEPIPDGPLIEDTEETWLYGGAGYPANPQGIRTGTGRSIIHISMGEEQDGSVKDINKLFEWNGSSAKSGRFTIYV